MNWSTLKYLDNGILNYEVNNLDSDTDYNDGVSNSTFTRTTYYYIYTDSNVIDTVEEIEQRVDQIILDLSDRLNEEIARAKASEKANSDNIDNETSERKKADTTLTATTTNLDTRVKTLENQTVWDFGTY